MDGWMDDLVTILMQQAQQSQGDMELHLVGHVIEYLPNVHMCRVLLPTRRGSDENGEDQVMETGWCQIGGSHIGNNFGDQYALKGGATQQNPEQGEQVQVSVQNRETGLVAVANMTYNDTMMPPGGGKDGDAGSDDDDNATQDTDGSLQLRPGERIIKHESGGFLKWYKNGDIGIFAMNDLVVNVTQDCKLTVLQGNLTVDVQKGNATITVDEGDLSMTATKGAVSITSGKNVNITAGEEFVLTEFNGVPPTP